MSGVLIQRQETPLLSGCVVRAARSRQHFSQASEDVDNVNVPRSRAEFLWAALRHGGEMSGPLTGCELLEGRDWVSVSV